MGIVIIPNSWRFKLKFKHLVIASFLWFFISSVLHFRRIAIDGSIPFKSDCEVLDVEFDQTGRFMNVSTTVTPFETWTVTSSPSEVFRSPLKRTMAARFSADGRILAVKGEDGVLSIWDTERRVVISTIESEGASDSPIVDSLTRFSDSEIVTLHGNGELMFHALRTGQLRRRLSVEVKNPERLLDAGNNGFLIVGSGSNDKLAAIYCVPESGELLPVNTSSLTNRVGNVLAASSKRLYGKAGGGYIVGIPLPGSGGEPVEAKVPGGVTAMRVFEERDLVAASVGIREFRGARGIMMFFNEELVLKGSVDTGWYYDSIDVSPDLRHFLSATTIRVHWKAMNLE